jgi:hypothetical protein
MVKKPAPMLIFCRSHLKNDFYWLQTPETSADAGF